MSRLRHGVGCLGAWMVLATLLPQAVTPAVAAAGSLIIDDSGTSALEPAVTLRWQSPAPARGGRNNLMQGVTTLRLRLNLTPWLHRNGRIYLALPTQAPGPIRASWTAQARLFPGQVQSGNRVLVYSGPITTPFLEDTLKIQFFIDGTLVEHAFPVTVHFEMDEG